MIQIKKISNINSESNKCKRLSVQISLTGLSFLISCANTNRIEWKARERWLYSLASPEELLERTIRVLENSTLDLKQIDEVKLYYHTPLYTLVPRKIWNNTNPSAYLQYTLKTLPNDFVANESILNDSIKLVYIPFVNLNNYFFEKFGSFHYYHALGPWIEYCSEIANKTTSVFANFTSKQLDLLVYKDGNLYLANSFEYHTPEDIVYYTLFIYEQLNLDPETIPIYLSGSIDKTNPTYLALYTYIRHVDFITTQNLRIAQFDEEESHKDLLLKLGL